MNNLNPYKNQTAAIKSANNKASFTDKIEISQAAKDMQISSDYSNKRAERVEQLKSEIQSGEYKVDARKTAEAMLNYYRG